MPNRFNDRENGESEYFPKNYLEHHRFDSTGESTEDERLAQRNRFNRSGEFDQENSSGQRHSQYEQGPYFGRGPKGYRRSDERIEEDINERLTQHPFLDATELEVSVQNGDVVLSGMVDDRNAKRIAEDIAESVSGVKDVQNQIRVIKNSYQNK